MTDDHKKDIDQLSGMETTGHEWDGLKELNNPLPRWWLWVMYATIAWSIVYFILYPAWPVPGGNTEGTYGYTQYKELAENQAEIRERQSQYLEQFEEASYQDLLEDERLYAFAVRGGEVAFKENCATCHGTGGAGAKGYPNLIDDDWLWGGSVEAIETTIRHGIRSTDYETRFSEMPAFGADGLLSRDEIAGLATHILSLADSSISTTPEASQLFEEQCTVCHGADARGLRDLGAPNLADAITLYGGSHSELVISIGRGPKGVMPHWIERLDENTIRQLAFYVHQLGGGEKTPVELMTSADAPVSTDSR